MWEETFETVTINESDVQLRPYDPKEVSEKLASGAIAVLLAVTSDDTIIAYHSDAVDFDEMTSAQSRSSTNGLLVKYQKCCCRSINRKGVKILGACCCGIKSC
jgi:hypothetical protein